MSINPLEILSRGTHTFCDLDFYVTPGVLIPREETELLANTATELLQGVSQPHIIDMCCGGGNLICTLAHRFTDAIAYGVDLTASCVRLAQRNVARHSIGDRASIHQGNMFSALNGLGLDNSMQLVVCNPPYIPTRRLETTSQTLLVHEPREAFDAGSYGMDIISQLISGAANFLRPGSPLCFEIGHGQQRTCKWLLDRSGLYHSIRFVENGEGIARVAIAFRN